MLIEHTFVTTLDAKESLKATYQFLHAYGFQAELSASPTSERGREDLQLRRGRSRPRDATESKQFVRLEWDRGRINLAATIEPVYQRRSFQYGTGRQSAKQKQNDAELMMALSRSLQLLLVDKAAPADAATQWLALETEVRSTARRLRIRRRIVWGSAYLCLLTFIICLATLIPHHPR